VVSPETRFPSSSKWSRVETSGTSEAAAVPVEPTSAAIPVVVTALRLRNCRRSYAREDL
jgi:hypothetical protein